MIDNSIDLLQETLSLVDSKLKKENTDLHNLIAADLTLERWKGRFTNNVIIIAKLSSSINRICKFLLYGQKEEVFKYFEFLNKFKDLNLNYVLDKLKNERDRNIFFNCIDFFNSIFVLEFISKGKLEQEYIAQSSDCFYKWLNSEKKSSKFLKKKKKFDDFFIEIFASEFMRMFFLGKYADIINIYENRIKHDLYKPSRNIFISILKLYYSLSQIEMGSSEQKLINISEEIVTLLKIDWYNTQLHNDYWGLPFYFLVLIQASLELTINKNKLDIFKIYEKIAPPKILEETSNHLSRSMRTSVMSNIKCRIKSL